MNKQKMMFKIYVVTASSVVALAMIISVFSEYGFSWKALGSILAILLICAFIAAMIAFFVKIIEHSREKGRLEPFEADYRNALKKIGRMEKQLMIRTENKFVGYIYRRVGNGRTPVPCVCTVYFLADKVYGIHVFKNHFYIIDIPYREVSFANVVSHVVFSLTDTCDSVFRMIIKTEDDARKLKKLLIEMRMFKRICLSTTGKMFLTFDQTDYENDYYAEFRFCDKDEPNAEEFVFSDHAENSLYICEEDFELFFKDYDEVLSIGDKYKYDLFKKAQYYSPDDTRKIIATIRHGVENGEDFVCHEVLCEWLSEAAGNHNGFFIS